MLITINCDASYCPDTKKSGYAFMICCNAGVFKKSGVFKQSVDNSTFAELMCIANALHFTRTNKELWGLSKIIIITDCDPAIKMITRQSTKMIRKNPKYRKVKGVITKYLGKYRGSSKIPYEFRHVYSHTNKEDGRSKANNWCDIEANKMRKL